MTEAEIWSVMGLSCCVILVVLTIIEFASVTRNSSRGEQTNISARPVNTGGAGGPSSTRQVAWDGQTTTWTVGAGGGGGGNGGSGSYSVVGSNAGTSDEGNEAEVTASSQELPPLRTAFREITLDDESPP